MGDVMGKVKEGVESVNYTIVCFLIMIFLGFALGMFDQFGDVFSLGGALTAFVTIFLTLNL